MEDMPEAYTRPQGTPVLRMDEMPVQLLEHVRDRIVAQPLRYDPETFELKHCYPEKLDYEYERKGTASVFMIVEPLRGWRYTMALPQRKRGNWA